MGSRVDMAHTDSERGMFRWETMKILAASIATFCLGITLRGDWLLLFVNLWMPFRHNDTQHISSTLEYHRGISSARVYLKDIHHYVIPSVLVTYVTFFGMGGLFHRWFYVNRRDQDAEWKCQPGKYLTKENENHALMMAAINMTVGSILSGALACAIVNGVPTNFYYTISDYGYAYTMASAILTFLFIDGAGFYAHRMYHHPYLYKIIHKWHHRYQQPMVWTAAAMHPVEFLTYQTIFMMPIFLIPLHPFVLVSVILYNYYYGILDHSGIKMAAIWPWQPHTMFHDYHHKFYHCNFGFNTALFDWLHGTAHNTDRMYSEHIFGGKGIPRSKER